MMNTLRITGFLAVAGSILAVAFFVFPAVSGVRSDEEVEQLLNSAGAVEKFKNSKDKKITAGEEQIFPLVKQAEAFALYLNPPPKPKKKAPSPRKNERAKTVAPRPAGPVSAKFKLIGTSYYASHPDMSMALIDEPGKGLRWVRQSSTVGHLVIEQVKEGLVVLRDGPKTEELVAERLPVRSLVKGVFPVKPDSEPNLPDSGKADTNAIKPSTIPKLSAEKIAAFEELVGKLRALEDDNKADDKDDSERITSERAALMEKLISDLQTTRITAEEAKKLDGLGKELRDVKEDPNQAKYRRPRLIRRRSNKIQPRPRDPNSPEKQ